MTLVQALMSKNGITEAEAIEMVKEMSERFLEGENPEEILEEEGLEPDYVDDLINS